MPKTKQEVQPHYESLHRVLMKALSQAQDGKGKERHATEGEPFEDQLICTINRRLESTHFSLGQAVKKIYESARLPNERAVAELLGAIVYIASATLILEEKKNGK